jgi:hypothetical protein
MEGFVKSVLRMALGGVGGIVVMTILLAMGLPFILAFMVLVLVVGTFYHFADKYEKEQLFTLYGEAYKKAFLKRIEEIEQEDATKT